MRSQKLFLVILAGSLLVIATACAPLPISMPVSSTGAAPMPIVETTTAPTSAATTASAATPVAAAATPVVTATLPVMETGGLVVALTTYRDNVGAFEIDYPADWSLVDVPAEVKQNSLGYSITLMSWQPQEGGTQGIPEGGSKLDIGVTLGGAETAEQAVEARRGELSVGDPGSEIVFEEPWDIAGDLAATHWVVKSAQGEMMHELIAALEGRRIVVSAAGDPALFEQIAMTLRPLDVPVRTEQAAAPAALTATGEPAATAGTTYTVQAGDTLVKIAARFSVTVRAILAANPQITNADRIYVGQRIAIPTGGAQPVSTPVATQRVQIAMIGIGDGSVGCGDSVVMVQRDIPKTPAPLTTALKLLLAQKSQYYGESGLYNALYQSNLSISGISRSGTAWTVRLTGSLVLGGVCDEPRVKEQLEQTARQFSTVQSVRFFVNGEALESLISGW